MNKTHWNTVTLDGTVPDEEVLAMIDDSYDLVAQSLTRAQREELARL
jgi:predicted DNA-binding protein (MmcQ/YjbR family)